MLVLSAATVESPVWGLVYIALFGAGWNPDLTVLEAFVTDDGNIGCDPERCAANAWSFGSPVEFLEFEADANTLYFFVVDGRGPNPGGDYQLQVQCATGGVEDICDDGPDSCKGQR